MIDEVSAYLNIAGLLFDILGVLLVFFFALPPGGDSEDKDRAFVNYPEGGGTPDVTPLSVFRARARIGLDLLVFGFCLQAVGNAVVFLA